MKTTLKYLLVLVLASFVFVGCAMNHCGSGKMAQWEYKTVIWYNTNVDQATLNEFGKDGWRLVSVSPCNAETNPSNSTGNQHPGNGLLYTFERPKH